MKLLNKTELRDKTSLSIQSITRLEKRGKFPKRVKLPPDFIRVGWIEGEVDNWLKAIVRQSRDS